MMRSFFHKNNLGNLFLLLLIIIFASVWGGVKFFLVHPLQKDLAAQQSILEDLRQKQEGQTDLLEKIGAYRDGLYGLDLLLKARKDIQSGSDPDDPYLVFDFPQLLNDLRTLLPIDARATKFQLNAKGLLTMPIESVDYASLGRVLKSFKDESEGLALLEHEDVNNNLRMFSEVFIPSGAQRALIKNGTGQIQQIGSVYSFLLQAQLNPFYWQNARLYPDVEPGAFYRQAVVDLSQAGVLEGYPDGYFRPLQPINRAEFFKVLLSEFLIKETITPQDYQRYADLSPNDWHFRYLQLARQMGLTREDQAQRFYPDQTLTRLEALRTVLNVFSTDGTSKTQDTVKNLPFVDVDADQETFDLVFEGYQKGLLDYLNQEFSPQEPVSRFEVAYWVWKLKFFSDNQ